MFGYVLRSACVALAAVGLAACGGGGGGSSSGVSDGGSQSTGSSESGNTVTTVVPAIISQSSGVSVTAATGGAAPTSYVALAIQHIGVKPYFISAVAEGSAVTDARVQMGGAADSSGSVQGNLDLTLYSPELMGAGEYTDTITVVACLDSSCNQPLAGSPIKVKVNYTVIGNPIPYGSFSTDTNVQTIEVKSTDPAPATSLRFVDYEVPPYGIIVRETSEPGGVIASMQYVDDTSARGGEHNGHIDVKFKTPADLGPGVYHDTVSIAVCYDDPCTKPATGSPWKVPLTLLVTAANGREFTERRLSIAPSAMAADASGQNLWVGTTDSVNGGFLLGKVDTQTGSIVSSVHIDRPAQVIAPSSDGRYVYFATPEFDQMTGWHAEIERVRLSDMTVDLTVHLPHGFTAEPTQSIAVSPANSRTFAVTYNFEPPTGFEHWRAEIYDDGTARPDTYEFEIQSEFAANLQWNADGTSIFVKDPVFRSLPVTASGFGSPTTLLSLPRNTDGFESTHIHLAGGLLYTDAGGVLDPATSSIKGVYDIQPPILGDFASPLQAIPDVATNRTFVTFIDSQPKGFATLASFDRTSFKPIWIARLDFYALGAVRYGNNGLALIGRDVLNHNFGSLYLFEGSLVAP